ncbi:hypothetical protein A1O1_08975 [Capronia coronata CBS 617.96]|uniref:Carboxylesterase type B domain-containing protein n=1 Tax=Capronia coronata CBS 617.96 TaxID=1182541 RepID=W9Y847_9EURO|nr:uncharacterized protein A1O1_08975 [Capronia coronata CBS 617.96]EXJ78574.1 hypothetical protein A1O1_08975 [Capronia coronata CBS 617.96]
MASPTITKVSLDVPALGKATGLCFDGQTCQYYGVPYATVPGRFRRPQPAPKPWTGNKWDGTKLGAMCPQPPRDYQYIPNPERPWVENAPISSTECPNLHISVPAPPAEVAGKPLYPVMVFVHGGAFVYGAGSAAIYDGRRLAQISQEQSMPTIIVTISYRVGVYGFLASKEIKEYNRQFGESGVGNYGIWDQIEALRWIQDHIQAFGGDPSRVTFFGQSAGGVSANIHMLRGEKLFSSAIIQSGLLPVCGVLSEEQYQIIYDKLLAVLEIPTALAPEQRLQRLIEMDESKVDLALMSVGVIPVLTLSPCDDHCLLPQAMPTYSSYSTFEAPSWCPRLMIGDVAHETLIWNKSFRSLDAGELISRIKLFLKDDVKAQKLMDLYQITPDMDRNKTFYKIGKFTTDGLFLAVHWAALRANPKMYAYRFDVPSPFETDFQAQAHHSLDNVFVWGLLKESLPPNQQRISEKMSESWLRFANGQEPWDRFDKNKEFMVFGPDDYGMRSISDDAKRGYAIWEEIEREGLMQDFGELADELCMRHSEVCDPNVPPKELVTDDFVTLGISTGNQLGGLRMDF